MPPLANVMFGADQLIDELPGYPVPAGHRARKPFGETVCVIVRL